MSLAEPNVVRSIQIFTVKWLQAASGGALKLVRDWEGRLLSNTEMRRCRPDTTNLACIDVGLRCGQAHEISSIWVDATSKQGKELNTVVASIRETQGAPLEHVCMNGAGELENKLSLTAAEGTVHAFDRPRELVTALGTECEIQLKKRNLVGMQTSDWEQIDQMGWNVTEHLCDARAITATRATLIGADHCNGAQCALDKTVGLVKSEGALKALHGEVQWASFAAEKQEGLRTTCIKWDASTMPGQYFSMPGMQQWRHRCLLLLIFRSSYVQFAMQEYSACVEIPTRVSGR